MTAINTNTAALNAQYYLAKSTRTWKARWPNVFWPKVNSAATICRPGDCQPNDISDQGCHGR